MASARSARRVFVVTKEQITQGVTLKAGHEYVLLAQGFPAQKAVTGPTFALEPGERVERDLDAAAMPEVAEDGSSRSTDGGGAEELPQLSNGVRAGTVSGTLRGPHGPLVRWPISLVKDGEPLVDDALAAIATQNPRTRRGFLTDAAGAYRFDDLPPASAGWTIRVLSPGSTLRQNPSSPSALAIDPGRARPQVFAPSRLPSALTGES
ncbi:MAG: hypothetical protein JST92_25375 [Deltaproteobacteria bacterium]|nr:hypothetical protein [Deltaproteobacteria bacterium]